MEIKIEVTQGAVGEGFVLALRVEGFEGTIELQRGYESPLQALEALVSAFTYAAPDPPDLTPYEAGLQSLSDLATGQEDVVSALGELGTRLNQVEDRLDGLGTVAAAAAPAKKSLLPGREVGLNRPQPAKAELRRPQPAPIRRQPPMTKDLPEMQRALPNRVHGQLFGGVSRRGMGPIEESGPGVDQEPFDPNQE